jgi:hypothetical protein
MKKIIVILLLFLLIFGGCKAKKNNNNKLLLLLLFLSNMSGENSDTLTIPSRLNLIDASTTASSAKSYVEPFSSARNALSVLRNDALNEIKNKSSAYYRDKPTIFSVDPVSQNFSMVDFFMQIFELGGARLLTGKGAYRAKFTMPSTGGSGNAEESQKKSSYTILSESNTTDDSNVGVLRKFTAWGDYSGGKMNLVAYVYEPISVKTVTIDGIDTKVQTGGKFTIKVEVIGNFNVNCIVKYFKEGGIDKLRIYYKVNSTFNGQSTSYDSSSSADIDMSNDSGTLIISSKQGSKELSGKAIWDKNYIYSEIPNLFSSSVSSFALSRKDPKRIVYNYGLYKQDGSRLNLKTGFPIKTSSGSSGWASSYGVYVYDPKTGQSSTLTNGERVTEAKYDGTEGDSFTVNVISGRANKNVVEKIPFSDVINATLDYYDSSNGGAILKVVYDGSNFIKRKSCNNNNQNCVDASGTLTINNNQFYNFRLSGSSKSLNLIGGQTSFTANIYTEIDSLGSPLTLYECFPNQATYTLGTDLILKDSNNNPVTTSKFSLYTSNICGNINSIYSASTTYAWFYGTNSWDKKTRLIKGDGSIFKFDKPLNFIINNGKTIFEASYHGFGSLYVPWAQDPDNVNDFMSSVPVATIDNGKKLSTKDENGSTVTYYAKQLSVGIKYNKTSDDISYLKSKTIPAVYTPSDAELKMNVGTDPLDGKNSKVCVLDGKLLDSNGNTVEKVEDSICK